MIIQNTQCQAESDDEFHDRETEDALLWMMNDNEMSDPAEPQEQEVEPSMSDLFENEDDAFLADFVTPRFTSAKDKKLTSLELSEYARIKQFLIYRSNLGSEASSFFTSQKTPSKHTRPLSPRSSLKRARISAGTLSALYEMSQVSDLTSEIEEDPIEDDDLDVLQSDPIEGDDQEDVTARRISQMDGADDDEYAPSGEYFTKSIATMWSPIRTAGRALFAEQPAPGTPQEAKLSQNSLDFGAEVINVDQVEEPKSFNDDLIAVDPSIAESKHALFQYRERPPSSLELSSTIGNYGLETVYREPYFSNSKDLPSKPSIFAGREFKFKTDAVDYLKEFGDVQGNGLWTSPSRPPSAKEVRVWFNKDREEKRCKFKIFSQFTKIYSICISGSKDCVPSRRTHTNESTWIQVCSSCPRKIE